MSIDVSDMLVAPSIGKSDLIARLFRRHWWEFWKPRMPTIRPQWRLVATLDPADIAGFLTPEQAAALIASTAPSTGVPSTSSNTTP